jgi:hypothetical protein
MKSCGLLLTGSHKILKISKQMPVKKKGVVFLGVFDKMVRIDRIDRHYYSYYL